MAKIKILEKEIAVHTLQDVDYICITDMARYQDADRTDYIIQNWLRIAIRSNSSASGSN